MKIYFVIYIDKLDAWPTVAGYPVHPIYYKLALGYVFSGVVALIANAAVNGV